MSVITATIEELKRRPLIYIAGPYTKGDMVGNIREAVDWMNALIVIGCTPICPHLSHLADLIEPRTHTEWLDYDAGLVVRCDAVVRIPGESVGADAEVELARAAGVKVFEAKRVNGIVFQAVLIGEIEKWMQEGRA